MPMRLRLILAVIGAGVACVVLALAVIVAQLSLLFLVLLLALLLAVGGYLLFVFVPRFDPTGSTLWRGPKHERLVALTFDDGPSPHTTEILALLAKYHAVATFFALGVNAERHPDLVAALHAQGHAVGNHGYSHRKMHRLGAAEIDRELLDADALLTPVAQLRGRSLVRLPHGFKSLTVLRRLRALGFQLVAWTSGVWDSDRPDVATLVARLRRALRPGAIVLLHDGDGVSPTPDRAQTVAALAQFIPLAQRAGYRFVTLAELFS